MSNMLNAKLSKLVYAPIADSPVQTAPSDRLVLLLRKIYQTIDAQTAPSKIVLRIRDGARHGRLALKSAPPQADAAEIRLKRWRIYLNLTEQLNGHNNISVSLDSVTAYGETEQTRLSAAINQMITASGLTAAAADSMRTDVSDGIQNTSAGIITHRGKSLSRINTQPKTEHYPKNKPAAPVRISRFSINNYKIK